MKLNETKLSSMPPAEDLGSSFVSELNKLSIAERDEVTCDVHGVNAVLNEDPEITSECFHSFRSELEMIPMKEKGAYMLALEQNPDHVTDKKFLLMFLRADQFDTKAAAARFVSFFQVKMELFGRDKLGRVIRVEDLDEDDIACLESGYAQVLSARDRADRAIFMVMPMVRNFKNMKNKLRAIYMVLMFALKDVNTQINGVIGIPYNVGIGKSSDRRAILQNAELVTALPVRFSAIHYCYDDENLRGIFYVAMYVFQKAARIRCRFHLGTDMEVIYTLMTFGIPNEALPVTFNGSLRFESHHDFIRKMRKADVLDDGIDRIIVPGKYDVLLGRGKPLQKYSGNLNYHYVIEGYHARYEQAAKGEKADLAMEIVKKINSQGGRFLKQDEAGWTVIANEAARSKVSHTFRNHRIAARTALKKAMANGDSTSGMDSNPFPLECQSRSVLNIGNCIDPKKRKLTNDFEGRVEVG